MMGNRLIYFFGILIKISLLKTLRFNFHYFNLRVATKLPVIVFKGVEFHALRGGVKLSNDVRLGMISLGRRVASIIDKKSGFVWDVNGNVIFGGSALLGSGCKISVSGDAEVSFGNNFQVTGQPVIDCNKRITFGDDCLLSWDILIMDSDYHKILQNNQIVNGSKDIIIGNHVWIGNNVTILKGVSIANNVIVACKSLLTKNVLNDNSVVSGCGKDVNFIKEGVKWEI